MRFNLRPFLALAMLLTLASPSGIFAAELATPEPPMGWNSYDAYGTTINETDFRANALWMSRNLKAFGWHYAVIDMEWFVRNPTPPGNAKGSIVELDENGRYVPAANRFPSAADGSGFKAIADYVHSLGLGFGIHILRGIPKEAVRGKLPIESSKYTAADAADINATCPWNPDNFGIKAGSAAGQAYYHSLAALYASWDVDFIKVDCIASHPYKSADIEMLSTAIRGSGRQMILSLSPGPAPLRALPELIKFADTWRISNDIWDLWHSTKKYPRGLGDQFLPAARWASAAERGHWPDLDMLSLGYLGPSPGWGQARWTRLTRAEQRTYMTLWCIARSPLMMGGNVSRMDDWTRSLLTNSEVLNVDQHASDAHEALARGSIVVWVSHPDGAPGFYVAVFNLGASQRSLVVPWGALLLTDGVYRARSLWDGWQMDAASTMHVTLASHASALYRVVKDGVD